MGLKVTVLGTYPIKNPRHGGQKRTSALLSVYKDSFQKVDYVAIVNPIAYRPHEISDADIVIPRDVVDEIMLEPSFEDLCIGDAVTKNNEVHQAIKKILLSKKPDLLILEQPFLYKGIKQIINDLDMKVKLIYSSHNVESDLKFDLYKSLGISNSIAREKADKVKLIENELVNDADLIISVTEKDEGHYKKMGSKNIVIAKNGTSLAPFDQGTLIHWKNYCNARYIKQGAFFAGSPHQPNLTGFMKMIGMKPGYLAMNQRILIAGGISELMETYLDDKLGHLSACFWGRVDRLGRISDSDISTVLSLSRLVLLPITEGGGSNLKTAEALLSGKNILATSIAFRGYEEFLDLPGVYIEDNPEKFRSKLVELISLEGVAQRSENDRNKIQEVTWENRLKNLSQTLKLIEQ